MLLPMTLRLNHIVSVLAGFWILITFASCKGELPPCSGNCTELIISGSVYNESTGTPIPNAAISITLNQYNYSIIGSFYTMYNGKTDAYGHYTYSTKFDSTLLKTNYLLVSATVPNNYLCYAYLVGPNINENPSVSQSSSFASLDSLTPQHLSFNFYNNSLLTVHLHRTTAIVPQEPTFFLTFVIDNQSSITGLNQTASNQDTTLMIKTAANRLTKIQYSKFTSTSTVTSGMDSIFCSAIGTNTVNITY